MENSRFKFRIWDKTKEKMIAYGGILGNNSPRSEGPTFPQYESRPIYHEISEPMQYTGMKANGKEIYEGDIIKGDLFDSRLPTMGQVVYDSHWGAFGNSNEGGFTFLHKINNIRVIGNIHDNPEMLITWQHGTDNIRRNYERNKI